RGFLDHDNNLDDFPIDGNQPFRDFGSGAREYFDLHPSSRSVSILRCRIVSRMDRRTRVQMDASRRRRKPVQVRRQISPCVARNVMLPAAAACGDPLAVSIEISGDVGGSYGSSMPVNPSPWPDATAARAFLYSPFGSRDSHVSIGVFT